MRISSFQEKGIVQRRTGRKFEESLFGPCPAEIAGNYDCGFWWCVKEIMRFGSSRVRHRKICAMINIVASILKIDPSLLQVRTAINSPIDFRKKTDGFLVLDKQVVRKNVWKFLSIDLTINPHKEKTKTSDIIIMPKHVKKNTYMRDKAVEIAQKLPHGQDLFYHPTEARGFH